jgi:hypothetical protein
MQYVQIEELEDSDQSLETLQSLLSLQTVDLCILCGNSIIAERKVKKWNFPYLPQDRQNPDSVPDCLDFLAESARKLDERMPRK